MGAQTAPEHEPLGGAVVVEVGLAEGIFDGLSEVEEEGLLEGLVVGDDTLGALVARVVGLGGVVGSLVGVDVV